MVGSPAGCKWKSVKVAATAAAAGALCFVFHDGGDNWDSGPTGKYYRVEKPGRFALKDGRVSEVAGGLAPVLVVTDLDGTYIGDEGAIAEFNDCWERQCVYTEPHASAFVYNTGRSWESTRQVMEVAHRSPSALRPPARPLANAPEGRATDGQSSSTGPAAQRAAAPCRR
jgi:hypothetical protein